jgi:hypothetical protein
MYVWNHTEIDKKREGLRYYLYLKVNKFYFFPLKSNFILLSSIKIHF